MKELWAYSNNRISVRLEYEWQCAQTVQWIPTQRNKHWEFENDSYMRHRDMNANDVSITSCDHRIGQEEKTTSTQTMKNP